MLLCVNGVTISFSITGAEISLNHDVADAARVSAHVSCVRQRCVSLDQPAIAPVCASPVSNISSDVSESPTTLDSAVPPASVAVTSSSVFRDGAFDSTIDINQKNNCNSSNSQHHLYLTFEREHLPLSSSIDCDFSGCVYSELPKTDGSSTPAINISSSSPRLEAVKAVNGSISLLPLDVASAFNNSIDSFQLGAAPQFNELGGLLRRDSVPPFNDFRSLGQAVGFQRIELNPAFQPPYEGDVTWSEDEDVKGRVPLL